MKYSWIQLLDTHIPAKGLGHVLLRTLVDQALFSPCGLAVFFTYMTLTEGGGQKALHRKFTEGYIPALRANYTIWPIAQIINFYFMPSPLQVPFISTVGVFWYARFLRR